MKVRKWLGESKEFLQVATIIIALAAIIISTRIALRQTKLMKASQVPILKSRCNLFGQSPQRSPPHQELTLFNIGGTMRSCSAFHVVFLKISHDGALSSWRRERGLTQYTKVVLDGYHRKHAAADSKDIVKVFKNTLPEGNLWRVEQTMRGFFDLAREKNFSDNLLFWTITNWKWELETYINIWYVDILGERHQELHISRCRKLNETPGNYFRSITYYRKSGVEEAIEEAYADKRSLARKGLSLKFEDLSPELLYEKLLIPIREAEETIKASQSK